MLSRFVIVLFPRSKHLLISWLQSPSAVILESEKIKFPSFPHLIAMKWWGQMPLSLFFEYWVLTEKYPWYTFKILIVLRKLRTIYFLIKSYYYINPTTKFLDAFWLMLAFNFNNSSDQYYYGVGKLNYRILTTCGVFLLLNTNR